MTLPTKTKKTRLNQLYAKKNKVAALLDADPKNTQLQMELDYINTEIGRLQYQTTEMENERYSQFNNDFELEL